ncbi:MAG: methyltransferase, partial [Rhodobacteraceae bacterium]
TSPKEWAENEKPDLVARARVRKEAILAQSSDALLPDDVDRRIRERFPIRLKR